MKTTVISHRKPHDWQRFVMRHRSISPFRPRSYEYQKAPKWLIKQYLKWHKFK